MVIGDLPRSYCDKSMTEQMVKMVKKILELVSLGLKLLSCKWSLISSSSEAFRITSSSLWRRAVLLFDIEQISIWSSGLFVFEWLRRVRYLSNLSDLDGELFNRLSQPRSTEKRFQRLKSSWSAFGFRKFRSQAGKQTLFLLFIRSGSIYSADSTPAPSYRLSKHTDR